MERTGCGHWEGWKNVIVKHGALLREVARIHVTRIKEERINITQNEKGRKI